MTIASIDIGSNTVLLLIAEVNKISNEFKTILNRYEAPRLGKGLTDSGNISEESIEKLICVLSAYKKLINQYNCSVILCTATNAMRIAKNSEEILRRVKDEFHINIEIITGEREAELSFLGASTVLPNTQNKIVIDIGGGSTELIYGNFSRIFYKKSFPVGAVNLTEQFIHNNIPDEQELKSLENSVKNIFKELKGIFPSSTPLIAVAGTPTSLSAINLSLTDFDEDIVEGSQLTLTDINKFIDEFSLISPSEILNRYEKIISGREDVILAGTFILRSVMDIIGNDRIYISGRGIRYGSVIDYLHKNPTNAAM